MTEDEKSDENRVAELERRLKDLETVTTTRLIQAGLRAEALKAGMIDLDGLKLLGNHELHLNEDGEVDGAPALMVDLQRTKPWLFRATSSSSSSSVPAPKLPEHKPATKMSYLEWQKAKAELIKRR